MSRCHARLAGTAAIATVVVAACTGQPGDPGTHRGPVSLAASEARLSAPDVVDVSVPSCNGDPEVTELVERGNDIRLEITATVSNPGDGCLDWVEVVLPVPLGNHDLVDLTSGEELTVEEPITP